MKITSNRFGSIEAEDGDVIDFPSGVIGFPEEQRFVLLRHGESEVIGWLQSAATPELAFPVVSAHGLAPNYPDVAVGDVATRAGVDASEEMAILAVLSAGSGAPATVNLLAPIVVNSVTRKGAQVILEGSRFSTRELFVFPQLLRTSQPPAESAVDVAASA